MRLFIARSPEDDLDLLVSALASTAETDAVATGTSGVDIASALRSGSTDVVLFPAIHGDLVRTVRRSVDLDPGAPPLSIIVATTRSAPLRVRATLSGFDGLVALDDGLDAVITQIGDVVAGRTRLTMDPLVMSLGVTPGLLARRVRADSPEDRHIAELVGAGLSDDAIARTMELSIQTVRNRIEGLLSANKLTQRTHLAVMCAADVRVIDFA